MISESILYIKNQIQAGSHFGLGGSATSKDRKRRLHFKRLSQLSPEKKFSYKTWGLLGFALLSLAASNLPNPLTGIAPERIAELEPKLLKALGEALIVAFAIAKIVDPYIKRRFAVELGSDLFWALFSSDSPTDFRTAVKQLASLKLYHRSNSWTLTFDWLPNTNDILKVEMLVEANGVNLDEKDYKPETTFWLLPSVPPYSSENNAWRFIVPDTDIREELNQEQIENLEKDERTRSQAINDIRVPQNRAFLLERRATIYQSSGTIPLVHRFTSLRQEYHFRGDAISDLKLEVRHTGASPEQKDLPTQTSLGQIDMTFNEITFPGQVTIVSWRLKQGRPSGNGQAPESQSARVEATPMR